MGKQQTWYDVTQCSDEVLWGCAWSAGLPMMPFLAFPGDMEIQLSIACQAADSCVGSAHHLYLWAAGGDWPVGSRHQAKTNRDAQHHHGLPVCSFCHCTCDKSHQAGGEHPTLPELFTAHVFLGACILFCSRLVLNSTSSIIKPDAASVLTVALPCLL